MASTVSFTEKAVALYGAKQTGGSGVPETLSASHALAALTLSFDDNITANEEAYLGNVMQREASVAITDRFADVKVETVLPRLGSLFGRPIYGYETAVLQFINSISSGTIIFAGVTMTVTSSATTIQLAEELLSYLNGGSATQNHSTFTGTPNANFSYVLNANDGSVILATALDANTNVTSLTLAGTQAANASLNVNNQTTGAIETIPFIPFMEASKFHVIIDTALSLSDSLLSKFTRAEEKLQTAYTNVNLTDSNFLNAERLAKKLDLLNLGATGNAKVDLLLANLTAVRVEAGLIKTGISNTITAIKTLKQKLLEDIAVDQTGAVLAANVLTTSAAVEALVTAIDTLTIASTVSLTVVNDLVNSNSAVNDEFTVLKAKIKDFYIQGKPYAESLSTLVSIGGSDAASEIHSADSYIQSMAFTTASLVPVLFSIEFTNEYASSDTLTLHVRKSSDKLVGLQKTIVVTDAVATADLTVEVGQRPKVAFNYHGNIYDIVNIAELSYPITKQKADAAYVTKAENVRNASLQETGTGLILNNICFSKLSASNIDGFEHQRVMTGCEDTWDTAAKAGSVTITILEPEANTDIATQFNTEDSLGKEFWFNFKQDGTSGNTIEVTLTKLILKGYKQTTVNNRAAFDLDFTFSGFAKIALK